MARAVETTASIVTRSPTENLYFKLCSILSATSYISQFSDKTNLSHNVILAWLIKLGDVHLVTTKIQLSKES